MNAPARANRTSLDVEAGEPRSGESPATRERRGLQHEELRLLHESLGNLLRETHLAYLKVLREKLRPHGINTSQWYFLRALWIEDGLIHRELSERTSTSRATTTTTLQVMVRDGLVTRVTCPEERRLVRFFLTKKAKALKGEIRSFSTEVDALSLQAAPAEKIQSTREFLLRMRGNLLGRLPAASNAGGRKVVDQ
jgi:DNA-binding MarR family transcriptional regulator